MRKLLSVFVFLLLSIYSFSESIYYYEDFSSSSIVGNGWFTNYRMARDGILFSDVPYYLGWGDQDTVPAQKVSNGMLYIYGRGNNGDLMYNNYWSGSVIKFVPSQSSLTSSYPFLVSNFTATPENPFGFVIYRYKANIDACNEAQTSGSEYWQTILNIWLAQDNGATDEWSSLDYFAYIYEKALRGGANHDNSGNGSVWGIYSGVEQNIDLTSLQDFDGNTYNLTSGPFNFKWSYDDYPLNSSWRGYDNYDEYGGDGVYNPNNNVIGIRVIHDGSSVKFYINPDPDDNDSYPNVWLEAGSVSAGWNTNLIVLLGNESLYYLSEAQEARYDNFLIRTVASSVEAVISPSRVVTNSTMTFTVVITNSVFTANDSGIGEIAVVKPGGFGAWNLSSVRVWTEYGDGSNNGTLGELTRITSGTPGAGQFLVKTIYSGSVLYIRFYMNSASQNNIVKSDTVNKTIKIQFDLSTPSTPSSTGYEFSVYVNCDKHTDTGQDWVFDNVNGIKYATVGWTKVKPSSADSLKVKVYTQPRAYASISYTPMPLYEGTEISSFVYEFSTSGLTGNPDIGEVKIQIPSGFQVSNIHSLLLSDSEELSCISVAGGYLTVKYADVGKFIPGEDGLDRITFNVLGTPDLPLGVMHSNYVWSSWVISSNFVQGTTPQQTTTNSTYPSQTVSVIAHSPVLKGYIAPVKVGTDHPTNYFTYHIINEGEEGNNFIKAKIRVPDPFTNVWSISSSVLGTSGITWSWFGTYGEIELDYQSQGTNLPSGAEDVVTFYASHRITNVESPATNVNFEGYADNGNTEGYVLGGQYVGQTWTVEITPPNPEGENYVSPDVVWTSVETFVITNYIFNSGAPGNSVKKARIVIPDVFTNIVSVDSSHISDDTTYITISGNEIILDYENDSGGVLKSKYDTPSDQDMVVITLQKAVSYSETNVHIATYVSNFKGEALCSSYAGKTNYLSVEFPPVMASLFLVSNNIDSSTYTNIIEYHITNEGLAGNRIHSVKILVPPEVSTNILDIWTTHIQNDSAYCSFDSVSNWIYINYKDDPGGYLVGGEVDVIYFKMVDLVEGSLTRKFLAKVKNDRGEELVTNENPTATMTFYIPKPESGGKVSPNIVYLSNQQPTLALTFTVTNAGSGSNRLLRVRIVIPDMFQGMITSVTSSNTGGVSGISVSSTDIIVDYSSAGSYIEAGGIDEIYVETKNPMDAITNAEWKVYADNGSTWGYLEGTNDIGSKVVNSTEQPDVNISPDTIYTTDTSSQFIYTIANGSSLSSTNIIRVRIKIPYPFIVAATTVANYSGRAYTSAVVSNDGYIYLNYSGTPIGGAEQSQVKIDTSDNFTEGETNSAWECEVDYGDGAGWKPTRMLSGNTNNVDIVLPPPEAYAYISPNDVNKDVESAFYTLTITNVGVSGNNIYLAKIVVPDAITNITSATSLILGSNVDVDISSGVVWLRYRENSTNIPSSLTDVITFYGWDNQDLPGYSSNWTVYVANTTNEADLVSVKDPSGIAKSLELNIVVPSYSSTFYVYPNQVSTARISNSITVYLNNVSSYGNDIVKAKVYLPYPFITNDIVVSSAKGGTATVESNYVLIDYSADPVGYQESDTISLTLKDEFDLGNTNCLVSVSANYNTSGTTFVDSKVSGGTNLIEFLMPQPDVTVSFEPDEIYTSEIWAKVVLMVSNKGEGSNELKRLKLTVPAPFRGTFDTTNVVSPSATNKSYNSASGLLTLYYSGIGENQTEDITIYLSNTVSTQAVFDFEPLAYNDVYETNCSGSGVLNVETPPSVSVSPSTLRTTDYSNRISFIIANDGSGTLPVKKMKVEIPSLFNNIISVSSSNGGVCVVSNGAIWVDYGTSGLGSGLNDILTVSANDTFNHGETNISWNVYVNSGSGWGGVRESYGGSLDTAFEMPQPEVYTYLVYSWYYFSEGVKTNRVVVAVSNYGVGYNHIYALKIHLPDVLTNAFGFTNSHFENSSVVFDGSDILVYYSNDIVSGSTNLLETGETDAIEFYVVSSIHTVTDVEINAYADNDNGLGWINTDVPDGETMIMTFNAPQESSEYYASPYELFTINNEGRIDISVFNASYLFGIDKVRLNWTNVLRIDNIASTLSPSGVSFSTDSQGRLVIDYPDGKFAQRKRDKLMISVSYEASETFSVPLDLEVLYEGSGDWDSAVVPETGVGTIYMKVADFGRISGEIQPNEAGAMIKVLNPDGTVATNRFGENLSTASSEGVFTVDFIPPGSYRLKVTAEGFKDFITNVIIESNRVYDFGIIRLYYAPFNADSTEIQSVKSIEDPLSEVIVPPGTLWEDFSLNIVIRNANSVEQTAALSSDAVPPQTPADMKVYEFQLWNSADVPISENPLKGDIIIKLHYEDDYIESQGWKEDDLAIFYWKQTSSRWVYLGGMLDKNANTITAKVQYLHPAYTIMPISKTGSGLFVHTTVSPNPFTPIYSDSSFNKVKLSFVFSRPVSSYTVRIYDMRGKLVKTISGSGEYKQGEVYWDGKDKDGRQVRSGVYVYEVTADDEVFRGSIILIK